MIMTQEEILDRTEVCPWRERIRGGPYVCARYLYTNVPCGGSCSWVFDYLNIKELEKRRISYDKRRTNSNRAKEILSK